MKSSFLRLVDRPLEVVARGEEADVEVQAQAHLLGLAQQRLPVVVDEPGQADLVVAGGEEDALVAHLVGAPHLGHRRLDVPERQHHHGDQPLGIGRAELGQPVVVGADALGGQLVRSISLRKTWLWKPRMFG